MWASPDLLQVGAKSLSVSLWDVEDESTQCSCGGSTRTAWEVRRRARRSPRPSDVKADALRKPSRGCALRQMRAAATRMNNPYYWSAFVLTGFFFGASGHWPRGGALSADCGPAAPSRALPSSATLPACVSLTKYTPEATPCPASSTPFHSTVCRPRSSWARRPRDARRGGRPHHRHHAHRTVTGTVNRWSCAGEGIGLVLYRGPDGQPRTVGPLPPLRNWRPAVAPDTVRTASLFERAVDGSASHALPARAKRHLVAGQSVCRDA